MGTPPVGIETLTVWVKIGTTSGRRRPVGIGAERCMALEVFLSPALNWIGQRGFGRRVDYLFVDTHPKTNFPIVGP